MENFQNIQNLLSDWLSLNDKRFPFDICQVRGEENDYLIVTGLSETVGIVVTNQGLSVSVIWEDTVWDFLICFDIYVENTREGFRCALCGESSKVYKSLQELWEDHIFEPFLAWCLDCLHPAIALEIHGDQERGATWAYLKTVANRDSEGLGPNIESIAVVPLWVNNIYDQV